LKHRRQLLCRGICEYNVAMWDGKCHRIDVVEVVRS
jgi:hypothetical protein